MNQTSCSSPCNSAIIGTFVSAPVTTLYVIVGFLSFPEHGPHTWRPHDALDPRGADITEQGGQLLRDCSADRMRFGFHEAAGHGVGGRPLTSPDFGGTPLSVQFLAFSAKQPRSSRMHSPR